MESGGRNLDYYRLGRRRHVAEDVEGRHARREAADATVQVLRLTDQLEEEEEERKEWIEGTSD